MTTTETYNRPVEDKKAKGWEQFKHTYTWAANAKVPLMARLGRTSKLMTHRLEETLNMSLPQVRILFEALDPEGISQSALHKQYKVDPASITRTVQTMERDGLITRRPDDKDNRLMRVYITEKGRELAEILPERLAQFELEMVKGLSNDQIIQLHTLLEHVEKNMSGANEEHVR